jgi:hypothetical protein
MDFTKIKPEDLRFEVLKSDGNKIYEIFGGDSNLSVRLNAEQIDRILKYVDAFKLRISLTWDVNDVYEICPELTESEAYNVLIHIQEHHDAECGISWDTLMDTAKQLYPGKEVKFPYDDDDDET